MGDSLIDEIYMDNSPRSCFKRNIYLSLISFFAAGCMFWAFKNEKWIGFLIFGILISLGSIVNIILAIHNRKLD